MNERMGARPGLAHTWAEHAALRERRGERATELEARAEALYRELGMTAASPARRRRTRRRP